MREFVLTENEMDRQDDIGVSALIDRWLETKAAKERLSALPDREQPLYLESQGLIEEGRLLAAGARFLRGSGLGGDYGDDEWREVDMYHGVASTLPLRTSKGWRQRGAEAAAPTIDFIPGDIPILTGALATRLWALDDGLFERHASHGYASTLSMAQHVSAGIAMRAVEFNSTIGHRWYTDSLHRVPIESRNDGATRGIEVGMYGDFLSITATKSFDEGALSPSVNTEVGFSPRDKGDRVLIDQSASTPILFANCLTFLRYAGFSDDQRSDLVGRAVRDAYAQTGNQFTLHSHAGTLFNTEEDVRRQAKFILHGGEVATDLGVYGNWPRELGASEYAASRETDYVLCGVRGQYTGQRVWVYFDRSESELEPQMRIARGEAMNILGEPRLYVDRTIELDTAGVQALMTGLILTNQGTSTCTHPHVLTEMIKSVYSGPLVERTDVGKYGIG